MEPNSANQHHSSAQLSSTELLPDTHTESSISTTSDFDPQPAPSLELDPLQRGPHENAANHNEPPVSVRIHKRKRLIFLAIVVVTVAIFAFGFFVYVHRESSAARKVSDSFISDMDRNNAPAAYQLTTSAFRQSTGEDAFADDVYKMSQVLVRMPVESYWNLNKYVGNDATAVVNYAASGHKGTGFISVTLQKVGNQWQVYDFTVQIQ